MSEEDREPSAPSFAGPSLVGTVLGRYILVRLLGVGGMGSVYEAKHQDLGRRAAIKTLHDRYGLEREARQRFLQEGQAAARIRHPNVADVYDVGLDGEHPYLVMELLDGENLAQLLQREGPLSVQRSADLLVPIVAAVAAAHDQGVVHRDLKPENIFLCTDRRGLEPKVLDFGISKLRDAGPGPTLTQSGVLLGTPHYMSPEQAQGAQDIDARSDQYSLGVILYECVTGLRPMHGAPLYALLHRTVQGDFPSPRQVLPSLPSAFEALVMKAMARRADARFPTTRALGAALLEFSGQRIRAEHAAELDDERPASAVPSVALPAGLIRGEQRTETAPESADSTLRARGEAATLVGRQLELGRLERFLATTARGSGRVVFLTGEAGIGKTALSDEFLRQASACSEHWIIATGRCLEHFGTAEAYLPFLEAVGALLAGDDAELVVEALETHAPTWCLQFPAVFGSAEIHERLERVTEGATRERMLRELAEALGALAAKLPVLLRLEDLHWADPASVDLLRLLCERVKRERLFVLGTFRPDHVDLENAPLQALKREMDAQDQCQELLLRSLSDRHLQDYLDRELAPNDFPPGLAALIAQKTEGNALFATRVIRSLVESNTIVRGAACWSLVRPPAEVEIEVPQSVAGMIQKNLESLPDEDWKTLQYASIEGTEFTWALLATLLDVDEMLLEDRLRSLARTHRLLERLGEETLPGNRISERYRFAHVLYQNVLYEQLARKRKSWLHLKAAAILVELYPEGAPRIATRIARHFECGQDFTRASQHWIHAGNHAANVYAYREAEKCYSHAFLLLANSSTSDPPLRASAPYTKSAWANVRPSEFNRVAADFTRLIEQARSHGNDMLEGAALSAFSHLLLYTNARQGESETHFQDGLHAAEASTHEGVQLLASSLLAAKLIITEGDLQQGELRLRSVIARARVLEHQQALLSGLGYLAVFHFLRAEYEAAEECFVEALSLDLSLQENFALIGGICTLAITRLNLGLVSRALAGLQTALERARRDSDSDGRSKILTTIARIHCELGAALALDPDDEQHLPRLSPASSEPARQLTWDDVAYACALLEADSNSVLRFGPGPTRPPLSADLQSALRTMEAWTEGPGSWHWHAKLRLQAGKCQQELTLGEFSAAERRARGLLETATRYLARKEMAIAHRQIAEARAECDDHRGAVAQVQAAIDLLQDHPAPLVTWKLHASLGVLYGHLGELESARRAYARASEIVQAIVANLSEESLRSAFLGSLAVREVFELALSSRTVALDV